MTNMEMKTMEEMIIEQVYEKMKKKSGEPIAEFCFNWTQVEFHHFNKNWSEILFFGSLFLKNNVFVFSLLFS